MDHWDRAAMSGLFPWWLKLLVQSLVSTTFLVSYMQVLVTNLKHVKPFYLPNAKYFYHSVLQSQLVVGDACFPIRSDSVISLVELTWCVLASHLQSHVNLLTWQVGFQSLFFQLVDFVRVAKFSIIGAALVRWCLGPVYKGVFKLVYL